MMGVAAAVTALLLPASCGGKGGSESHESAEELEAAKIAGREAARGFLNRPWRDTLEVQSHLLEVRAIQSKYVTGNKPESARMFDSAFVSTLRTVDPAVAAELEAIYDTQQ